MHLDLSKYQYESLAVLIAAIEHFSPKPVLGDLRLRDLAAPRTEVTGLYAFIEADSVAAKWLYIGKSSSRSFIGRMSAHCDPRDEDYDMNNFVKAVKYKDNSSFFDAQQRVLNSRVVFIEVPKSCTPNATGRDRSTAIGRLERRLQRAVATRYNRHPKDFDPSFPDRRYMSCTIGQILDA